MKKCYSILELAKLALPGMPASPRGIDKYFKRKNIVGSPRQASGGGLEYPFSALPPDAQAALLAREAPPPAPVPLPAPPSPPKKAFDPLVKAAGDAAAAQLQGRAQQRLNDRLTLLDSFAGLTGNDLLTAVVRYNTGELNVPAEIRARIPRVSVATLHRWRAQVQRLGLARVAGQFGNRKGSGLIDTQPQLAAALRGLLVEFPHVRPSFAAEFLAARYQDSGLTLPLPMTVRRWLNHWKAENAELYCRLRDPDAWKSRYMMGVGDASAGILRLNQEWQFDSTQAELLLIDDRRHSLIGVIDVYSRRAAFLVSKTSKATAIAALLRKVLLAWGVPEKVKTDNGQDYVSHHIVRILQALGIEHERSAPFSPWQKPHIERLFRTFLHDLVELLPGYIGHNVAEREQLRARQQFSDRLFVKNSTVELPGLSAEELQAFCDRWCAAYHTRPHSGLAGQSPLVKAAAWREPIRAIRDERVLDLLLAPAPGDGWRTVSKSNGIQIDGYDYLAGALGLYAHQRVRVLYDPEGDMGQVWCFDAKGNFIAVAECPELRNLDRQAIAAVIKANQLQKIREEAKAARAEAKSLNLKTAVEEVQAARDAAAATLVAFPAPTVPHVTPHIAGAETALRGDDALGPDGPTPELLKAIGYVTEPQPAPAPVIPLPRSYNSHSERVRDIYARAIAHGLEPDADDLIILSEYYNDPAGRAGSKRLDDLLRKLYPAVDLAALKRRWLGMTISITAQHL